MLWPALSCLQFAFVYTGSALATARGHQIPKKPELAEWQRADGAGPANQTHARSITSDGGIEVVSNLSAQFFPIQRHSGSKARKPTSSPEVETNVDAAGAAEPPAVIGIARSSSATARPAPSNEFEEAEASMHHAIENEVAGIALAQISADTMVKAAKAQAHKVVQTTKQKLIEVVDVVAKDLATNKAATAQLAKRIAEKVTAVINKTENDAQAAVRRLQLASKPEEIAVAKTSIMDTASEATGRAETLSVIVASILKDIDNISAVTTATVLNASTRMRNIQEVAASKLKTMAETIDKSGVTALDKLSASDEAKQIADATHQAATDIMSLVEVMNTKNFEAVDHLSQAGKDALMEMGSKKADAKALGDEAVQRLAESAQATKESLTSGSSVWLDRIYSLGGSFDGAAAIATQKLSRKDVDSSQEFPSDDVFCCQRYPRRCLVIGFSTVFALLVVSVMVALRILRGKQAT